MASQAALVHGVLLTLAVIGSAGCLLEPPRSCDGVLDAGEECDDGNQDSHDGCHCAAHPPWSPPLGGMSREGFVVIEDDGAWCWFQDERVIIDAGRIIASSVSHAGDIQVSSYHLETGARAHGMLHRSLERDDHDAPALLPLPDGRLAAFYTRHDGFSEMRWRISDSSSLEAWGPEQTFDIDDDVTYANPFLLAGDGSAEPRLHLFFRGYRQNPTVAASDDLAATFGAPRQVLDSHTSDLQGRIDQRPYVKYASNGEDEIHLFYTEGHPAELDSTSLYHLSYRDGRLLRTDATPVAELRDHGAPSAVDPRRGTRIHDGRKDGTAWPWDAALDPAGQPIVVFSVRDEDQSHDYYYALWDGSAWRSHMVAHAGTAVYAAEPFYTGGIAIDPDDPSIVYLSTNVDPETGESMNGHFEIYRGTTRDGGASWSLSSVTSGSTVDNLRPTVPVHHPPGTAVAWMQGTYHRFIDYNTRIVALIGAPDARIDFPPVQEPLRPIARFDLTSGPVVPRPGFVPAQATGPTLDATDGGVRLDAWNIDSEAKEGRRSDAVYGRGCLRRTALTLRLSHLNPQASYLVRLHAHDTGRQYLGTIRWFDGIIASSRDSDEMHIDGDSRFLGALRLGKSSTGGDSTIDLVSTSPGGSFGLIGSGLCTGESNVALLDAVELFELPASRVVALFDVDRALGDNTAVDWRTGRGYVSLAMPGQFRGSARDGAIEIAVTLDQPDDLEPNRYRGVNPGSDSVVAHDGLVVDVKGLEIGATYTITVHSAETDRYLFSASRWELHEAGRLPRVVRGMQLNARTTGGAGSFTFLHVASTTSFRLRATDIFYRMSTDPSVVLFSAMEIAVNR